MSTQVKIFQFCTFFALILTIFCANNLGFLRNCADVHINGVFKIRLDDESRAFDVLCNHQILGGDWTVIMNRMNGSIDFSNQTSAAYRFGFGNFNGEFFLGLNQLSALTSDQPHMVVFIMKDFNDFEYISTYDIFEVHDETYHYSTGDMTYAHAGLSVGFTKFNAFCDSSSKVKCENNIPGWQLNPYAEPKGLTTKTVVQLFGKYPQNDKDTRHNNMGIFYRNKDELIPLKSLKMMIRTFALPANYKVHEKMTNELDRRFFGTHPKCLTMPEDKRKEYCQYAMV